MDRVSINLLRTKSGLSEQDLTLLHRLRFFTIGLISIVLLVGIFVGFAYMAGRFQYDQLERKRVALSRSISAQSKKQVLLLSLQERIPIIQKVFDFQYPWDKAIDNILEIFSPSFLNTVSIENNNLVKITTRITSLEELESIVVLVIKQTRENKIRSPVINSLVLEKDGKIEAVFTFTPVL